MSGARRAFKGVGYQSNADIPPSMMMSRAVYIAQAISDPPVDGETAVHGTSWS